MAQKSHTLSRQVLIWCQQSCFRCSSLASGNFPSKVPAFGLLECTHWIAHKLPWLTGTYIIHHLLKYCLFHRQRGGISTTCSVHPAIGVEVGSSLSERFIEHRLGLCVIILSIYCTYIFALCIQCNTVHVFINVVSLYLYTIYSIDIKLCHNSISDFFFNSLVSSAMVHSFFFFFKWKE